MGEDQMGLYKLRLNNDQLQSGVMERDTNQSIDYEKDFENWLKNSPSVLLDDEGSTEKLHPPWNAPWIPTDQPGLKDSP